MFINLAYHAKEFIIIILKYRFQFFKFEAFHFVQDAQ